MTASNYDACLAGVLESEGGYSNDEGDPGGPTKYGITIIDARKYWMPNATASDVKAMPLSIAKSIYRSKYWQAVRGDDLPSGVDYAVFDYGVNSGVGRAAKVLRELLHLPAGSTIDDATVAAARKADATVLVSNICAERLEFLEGLRTWSTFGRGWGSRVAKVKSASIAMAAKPAPRPVSAPPTDATKHVTGAVIAAGGAAAASAAHYFGFGSGVVVGALAVGLFVAMVAWLVIHETQKGP